MKKTIYAKYSNDRAAKFNICTEIRQDENGRRYVIKKAYSKESEQHIHNIIRYSEILSELCTGTCFKINKCSKDEDGVVFDYAQGESLEKLICVYEERNEQDKAEALVEMYIKQIRSMAGEEFAITDEFKKVFGDVKLPAGLKSMKVTDIDLIFNNIIVSEEDNIWNVLDYEWTFEFLVPVNYVIYRAVFSHIINKELFKKYGSEEESQAVSLYEKCGITEEEIAVYEVMEQNFQAYVGGDNNTLGTLYNEAGKAAVEINEILDIHQEQINRYNFQIYYNYGEGFCEEASVYHNIQPDQNGVIEVKFDINDDLVGMRIDPGNKNCIVKMESVNGIVDGKEQELEYAVNGYKLDGGVIVYPTDDPQIIFDFTGHKCTGFSMCLRLNVDDVAVEETIMKADIAHVYKEQALETDRNNIQKQADEIAVRASDLEQEKNILEQAKNTLEQERNTLEQAKNTLENEKNEIIREKQQLQTDVMRLNNDLRLSNEQYQHILQSGSWKITAPMRGVRRFAIKHFNNKVSRQFMRGVHSLSRNGVKVTAVKVSRWGKKKIHGQNNLSAPVMVPSGAGDMNISRIAELQTLNKKIAVQVHLYYEDLLEEFCNYLSNIPFEFDLFISCQEKADIKRIETYAGKIPHVGKVTVKGLPNRGRDIAPVFVWFAKDLEQYDYFLHMHSKKSLYTGTERAGWRQYSLDSIIGSESLIRKIFTLFEDDNSVGLVYPDNHPDVPMLAYSWLANEGEGRKLLASLGVPFEGGIYSYPAGSFYWARVEAIRPLFDRRFIIEDFPEEAGQTDGTLAHAIERGTAFVARHRGYGSGIVDFNEGVIRRNSSKKAFRPYFDMNKNIAKERLSEYDVISFDIFDTLITRCVLKPDDVFELMRRKIECKYKIKTDYLAMRKQAEANAWQKKLCYTNIHDIYEELPAVMNISHELAMELKELEIQTEIDVMIPRRDILEVFNYLKSIGKRIILTSDMYMTTEVVTKFLNKCGYDGWDEMLISCECGLRKDADTIWNDVLTRYAGQRFIHIGDNPRSDWQTLIDRRSEALWIINPYDAFKMDDSYEQLKDIVENDKGRSIEDSILLGMAINGGIFNSPWSQTPFTGIPEVEDAWTLGYGVFGAMLTNYIKNISDNMSDNKILLFLAREGYILQKMYKDFTDGLERTELENYYFQASRRCVTVAAIQEDDDMRKIIGQYYRGKLSNMLKSRLGVDMPEGLEDREISLDMDKPEDTEVVMKLIAPVKDKMYQQFAVERAAYFKYIESIAGKDRWADFEVLDVGYSGTIQYFLSKLLDEKIGGYYLATFKTKPDKIGCPCDAVYTENNSRISAIQRTQLFLESVLQAPYGQLIRFTDKSGNAGDMQVATESEIELTSALGVDEELASAVKLEAGVNSEVRVNGVVAEHKNAETVHGGIVELQQGMMDYAGQYGCIVKDIYDTMSDCDETVIRIYDTYLHGKYMSAQVADIFGVEDDYCSNKTLKFNRECDSWM